jgi:preprotein translocase subunit SecG
MMMMMMIVVIVVVVIVIIIIIIIRDFQMFGACHSNKHCPSARCAYAANVVGKDLDVFAVRDVSLRHIAMN